MLNKKWILLTALSLTIAGGIAAIVVSYSGEAKVYHTVTFDTNGGTPIEPVEIEHGKKLIIEKETTKLGYHIKNWLYNNAVLDFEKFRVEMDMTVVTNWELTVYTIDYDFDGGTTEEQYETTYTIDSQFDLVRPESEKSVFTGWFDENGKRIDSIKPGNVGNIKLKARWIDNLVLQSLDETKGSIAIYGSDEETDTFTAVNVPTNKGYHLFSGWYDQNNVLLSTNQEYTFKIKRDTTNYIFSKYMDSDEEAAWNADHGVVPLLNKANNNIVFGMYPQSNVCNSDLIEKLEKSTLTNLNGYHYYNHDYYLKKKASLYSSEDEHEYLSVHDFDNGTAIVDEQTYWFKVEPIQWRILKNDSGVYTIMTEKLLDRVRYFNSADMREIDGVEIYPNNYKYSTIREWMNDDFYNNAFYFNKEPLLNSIVDNSSSTTAIENNKYVCENTNDYVYALSYREYLKKEYEFSEITNLTPTRTFKTTDLARASGALYSTKGDNLYCGYAWTRSPYYSGTETRQGLGVSRISQGGTINSSWNGANYSCAQPCVNIAFSF